jgi:predicted transcriptional regulator
MRSRSDDGKYDREYEDEVFVSAVRKVDGGYATEIAEEAGVIYETTLGRLKKLEEEGVVEKKKIGDRYLWNVTQEEETPDE